MPGHYPWPVQDLDPRRGQPHRQTAPGVADRHGVVTLPHRHPGPGIDLSFQQPGGVERLVRQRRQLRQLGGERGGDDDRPAGDHPVVVGKIGGSDQLIQPGQRGDPRNRHQVTATEPADLTLDAALLMRAFLAGDAEEPVETGGPWVHEF